MSSLTAKLVRRKNPPRRKKTWEKKFTYICNTLEKIYGVPSLGNVKDPAWEIFYILLSAKTAEIQYQRAFRILKKNFPKLDNLASARPKKIHSIIKDCGFGPRRVKNILCISRRFLKELGPYPSRKIRKMTAEKCYSFLNSLPGIGPKSALCVMMYSLDYDVFPVDVNVHRVAERLGALNSGVSTRQAQKILPALVPDGISKKLHVTMLIHGRKKCLHKNPSCNVCEIRECCLTSKKNGDKNPDRKNLSYLDK